MKILITSVAAIGLGTLSAVGAARVAENLDKVPIYDENKDRYDLSTFSGRYKKMLSNNDPSTLLLSKEKIAKAKEMLKNKDKYSDKELWTAKKHTQSTLHPDTEDVIPAPFRMSGYVPFNGPICAAMMATSSTTGLLFWNWVNQSQNALVNYYNRNASSNMSDQMLLISYGGAVTSALSVAFGLSFCIRRFSSPATAMKLMKFVAFPSSMVASSSNCYIMRRPEIQSGIEVSDENGAVLADGFRSKATAEKAVFETVLSRALLQIPVFLGPALIMSLPLVTSLLKRKSWLNIPLMSVITMTCFSLGLPATIAIFPQQGSIEISKLEVELQQKLNSSTSDVVFYNKGL